MSEHDSTEVDNSIRNAFQRVVGYIAFTFNLIVMAIGAVVIYWTVAAIMGF